MGYMEEFKDIEVIVIFKDGTNKKFHKKSQSHSSGGCDSPINYNPPTDFLVRNNEVAWKGDMKEYMIALTKACGFRSASKVDWDNVEYVNIYFYYNDVMSKSESYFKTVVDNSDKISTAHVGFTNEHFENMKNFPFVPGGISFIDEIFDNEIKKVKITDKYVDRVVCANAYIGKYPIQYAECYVTKQQFTHLEHREMISKKNL